MFEANWQQKIKEKKYDKLSYETSLKLILKDNEELKSKVLDLMKNKNHEFVASRSWITKIYHIFQTNQHFWQIKNKKLIFLSQNKKRFYLILK